MKNWSLLFIALLLAVCSPLMNFVAPTTASISPTPTLTPIPAPSDTHRSILVTATPRPYATWTSDGKTSIEIAGLVIMSWELATPPEFDPLKFITKDGAIHTSQEMGKGEPVTYNWISSGAIGMETMLGNKKLVASLNYNQDYTQGWVAVSLDSQEIYRINTGKASPISDLRNITAYDNHWVLETNHYTDDTPFNGKITEDGILLNDKYGYEEAFNFQTINEKPLYLFKRNGKIDLWFDGQQIPLDFDQIPHYSCCSEGELNPRQWTTMLAFFGARGKIWYFVQIGTPDSFK
jgi:hypothetical protein